MKKIIMWFMFVVSFALLSGCAKYYYTSPNKAEEIKAVSANKIPVKLEFIQHDWSIVVKQSDEILKEKIQKMIANSSIFIVQDNSDKALKIELNHSNDHGGAEIAGAMLTGASLYLIPGIGDSDVNINISFNDVVFNYKGELVVAQGLGASSMVDTNKYTEDVSSNLIGNLVQNAFNEFTLEYLKRHKM